MVVKTQIRDPRDLLRGQYVFISYVDGVQTYSGPKMDEICTWDYYNKTIYVVPALSWNNFTNILDVSLQNPIHWNFIKAKISYCDMYYPERFEQKENTGVILSSGFRQVVLQYAQDRFFIKEWTGKPLEDAMRTWDVYAVWRVSDKWNTVLSHLVVDWEVVK